MKPLSDQDFKDFLEDYNKHYLSSDEISRSVHEDEFGNRWKGRRLVHNKFPMYSLDDMKDECRVWNNYNKPKSTDGIFCWKKDGKLVLYLVEFKGHNLNDKNKIIALKNKIQEEIEEYKKDETEDDEEIINDEDEGIEIKKEESEEDMEIQNLEDKKLEIENIFYKQELIGKLEDIEENYIDSVQHSLEQKPVETLLITIPTLYKDYCKRNRIPEKDIYEFLRTHEKRFFVFAFDEEKKEEKNDREKDDDETKKNITPLRTKLNGYYLKLKRGKIIDFFFIYDFKKFEWWLNKEKLKRPPRRILEMDIHKFDDEFFNY